jgi:GTP pyrophosphokinase
MKTAGLASAAPEGAAPIIWVAGGVAESGAAPPPGDDVVERARGFAAPLLDGTRLDTGEDALSHADGVAAILQGIGAAPSLRAAAYLVYAGDYLTRPEELIAKAFGAEYSSLVAHTRKLVQIQRNARGALADDGADAALRGEQIERVRKMLLAFSRDLRVVLLRLASRLQTLRFYAASKQPCPGLLAQESAQVFAPLANRLGIWPVKWELEDLSFRFLQPEVYKQIARLLDEKRVEREQGIERVRDRLAQALLAAGLRAEVSGRPKHLYSIWKKMQGKQLDFERVLDVRALRVLVDSVPDCYAALSAAHELWQPLPEEFDDYIARPKPNGYQSLHTVVRDERGRPIEIQIRTRAMHEHAESGVAAHWAYKEAGAKGYAGVSAAGNFEERVAEARRTVLRQLLAWERELAAPDTDTPGGAGLFDDRIYVFTPQGAIVELPAGATPIDFAYTLHTDLGHRCRGARVDGVMVPLNTPLQSGQTVEVSAIKEGGPSLDWVNAELGYLKSARARAKVRAWFNALAQQQTIARGREAVEKLLQREGKTAIKLDELAARLGFRQADALFEVVGKDEFSLRNIEQLLRPAEPAPDADELLAQRLQRAPSESPAGSKGGVLVVGVESLLTTLARCCKPAPPDPIGGYVTRGRGVAVHRADCSTFRQMAGRQPERVIPVTWGSPSLGRKGEQALYPVDVTVESVDRQGLLRDISEAFAKEKTNVIGVRTHSAKGLAWMSFTIELGSVARLGAVLSAVRQVLGVRSARRR